MVKHISCDCKYKFNRATCNSNQKWNHDKCQLECKNYQICKNDYNWNPSKCICENGKYLKTIADNSKIEWDEIMYIMDIVPTNMTTNSVVKKVRYEM